MSSNGGAGPLFVLAADHRFEIFGELLGADPVSPGAANREKAAELKQLVFAGILQAVEDRVPKSQAAVWTDADLGESVLLRARAMNLDTMMSIERPRASAFRFQDALGFSEQLKRLDVTYAAARVLYNPGGDADSNEEQRRRLHRLSEICRSSGPKLLLELALAPTPAQLEQASGMSNWRSAMRPGLALQALRDLQDVGVAPDLWVFEALPDPQAMATLAAQARVDGRECGTLFTTGEVDDDEAAMRLVELAARTPGVEGLVIGPSAYREQLASYQSGEIDPDRAAAGIAARYVAFYDGFTRVRSASGVV